VFNILTTLFKLMVKESKNTCESENFHINISKLSKTLGATTSKCFLSKVRILFV